jgi:iron complex transport system ATP-binding protein
VTALTLDRVSVAFDGVRIVEDVSAALERGEWLTVIGPNGAGKSTLLRAVAGLVACSGAVLVGGVPARALTRRELARRIAFVPQEPHLPSEMSVGDYVLLGRTPHLGYFGKAGRSDLEAADRALVRLDLTELAGRRLGTLSGGERQRAVLARALAQDAPLLLLDEPTSSLDIGRGQQVLELVDGLRHGAGLTVLATMHDLTLAGQYADQLVFLDGGRVVARGAPRGVLTRELIAKHYGASVRVVDDPVGGPVVVPLRTG